MADHPNETRRRGVLGWLAAHPKTTVALVGFVLLIATIVLVDRVARSHLRAQLDAIRAAGQPTTIDDLNARIPQISSEENIGVALVVTVQRMLTVDIPKEKSGTLPFVGRAKLPPTGRRLPPQQMESARWYLDAISNDLADLHAALELERGCLAVRWRTPAMDVAMPELSNVRQAARGLALEARVAAEDGDRARTLHALEAMFRLDVPLRCNTSINGGLVRVVCSALTQLQIERTVNLGVHDDASLLRLQSLLGEYGVDLKEAMMTERVVFIDTMQWLQTRPTSRASQIVSIGGGGALSPDGWYGLIPMLPVVDMSRGIAVYSDYIDGLDRPDAAALRAARKGDRSAQDLPAYCVLSRMVMPSLSRSIELWLRATGSKRALQAGLACERYRLANGRWPEQLDDLVPDYLDAVPRDPFDDEPIRYARIEGGIRVWCIGEDLTDDGGDVKRLVPQSAANKPKDLGWVILNPDLRGRPAETKDD
ncbi:MAG: hypothetical protein ACE5F9_15055 [Phycisphaerae bacterium]